MLTFFMSIWILEHFPCGAPSFVYNNNRTGPGVSSSVIRTVIIEIESIIPIYLGGLCHGRELTFYSYLFGRALFKAFSNQAIKVVFGYDILIESSNDILLKVECYAPFLWRSVQWVVFMNLNGSYYMLINV